MILRATAAGERIIAAAGRSAEGEVFGIYAASVYLTLDRGLILCADEKKGRVSFGISMPEEALRLLCRAARPGQRFTLTKGELRLPEAGVCISLPRAGEKRLHPPLPPLRRHLWESAFARLDAQKSAGMAPLAGMILRGETQSGNPLLGRAFAGVRRFLAGFEAENAAGCREAIQSLLGLGAGLTPSADDLLTGFFFTWAHYGTKTRLREELTLFLEETVWERTTRVSACYLCAAARGEEMELLETLLLALCGVGELAEAMDRLLTVGHSSGGEMAAGLLLGTGEISGWIKLGVQ